MIKGKFKLLCGRVLLIILMLCESLLCQNKADPQNNRNDFANKSTIVDVHTRSDYCYSDYNSQCELNQGPCYGNSYCKGNLVCGYRNCELWTADNCCKCNCNGLDHTGFCDSEDGTCYEFDNYGYSNEYAIVGIVGPVTFFIVFCCCCSCIIYCICKNVRQQRQNLAGQNQHYTHQMTHLNNFQNYQNRPQQHPIQGSYQGSGGAYHQPTHSGYIGTQMQGPPQQPYQGPNHVNDQKPPGYSEVNPPIHQIQGPPQQSFQGPNNINDQKPPEYIEVIPPINQMQGPPQNSLQSTAHMDSQKPPPYVDDIPPTP